MCEYLPYSEGGGATNDNEVVELVQRAGAHDAGCKRFICRRLVTLRAKCRPAVSAPTVSHLAFGSHLTPIVLHVLCSKYCYASNAIMT